MFVAEYVREGKSDKVGNLGRLATVSLWVFVLEVVLPQVFIAFDIRHAYVIIFIGMCMQLALSIGIVPKYCSLSQFYHC